jgi:hypothetical protein
MPNDRNRTKLILNEDEKSNDHGFHSTNPTVAKVTGSNKSAPKELYEY